MTDKKHENAAQSDSDARGDRHGGARDVTAALELAEKVKAAGTDASEADVDSLIKLLEGIDARTGKRDPSKRSVSEDEASTKSRQAVHHAKQLRTFSFGGTDWLSIITTIIGILQQLHVLQTQPSSQTPPAQG